MRRHEVECARRDTFSELRMTCCKEKRARPELPDQPDFTYIDKYTHTHIHTYTSIVPKEAIYTHVNIYLAK